MHFPIYEGLKQYRAKNRISFHMPGHKGKGDAALSDLFELDITELPDTDDLHSPEGYIAQSEQLLSSLYGTAHSFYLMGGSTCGIFAMLSSTLKYGDTAIIDRGCHKSVIHALGLLGINPVYVMPDCSHQFDFPGGISPEKLSEAIEKHPHAKAVLITSPNYYGVLSDIQAIADITHRADMVLLVDEAHGAHLPFSGDLPQSAIGCGADLVVQSAHKTLGALSGCALLHVVSNRVNAKIVRKNLAIFQTSSPCYGVLAALERAVFSAQKFTKDYKGIIKQITKSRAEVNATAKAYWVGAELTGGRSIFAFDPTRIVINFSKIPLSGYDVARILREKYKIEVEMADRQNIVCIATPYNDKADIKHLEKAVCAIVKQIAPAPDFRERRYEPLPIKEMVPLHTAYHAEAEKIHMEDAQGRAAKHLICKYPPGVPLLCPGEEITPAHIREIISILDDGGTVSGIEPEYQIEVIV
ncbi:MAG: aminotransferase class I/II-fold pyridoxal phosphate-dependent enzyme [Ruminococcaceae bacterium]|nr:aminotransferase class I/II-fold pyridoxal phosphate-dependent enzyme [Oscillospiraceae bacterium]